MCMKTCVPADMDPSNLQTAAHLQPLCVIRWNSSNVCCVLGTRRRRFPCAQRKKSIWTSQTWSKMTLSVEHPSHFPRSFPCHIPLSIPIEIPSPSVGPSDHPSVRPSVGPVRSGPVGWSVSRFF